MDESGFLNDIVGLMSQQGPDAWYLSAQQLAVSAATGDDGDPNPDVATRQRVESLAPLVIRRMDALLGVAATPRVDVVNRRDFALRALTLWRPFLQDRLANDIIIEGDDATSRMFRVMAPLFLGMQAGSAAGHAGRDFIGMADLPLPREAGQLVLEADNVVRYANAGGVPTDDLLCYALAREAAADVVLSQPGLSDAMRALFRDAVQEGTSYMQGLFDRLRESGSDPAALVEDPSVLFQGDVPSSPSGDRVREVVAVLSAYLDTLAREVTFDITGPKVELVHEEERRREQPSDGLRRATALFGFDIAGDSVERARQFVATIYGVEGVEGLAALWRADGLPTSAEVLDPRAWRARVENSPLA